MRWRVGSRKSSRRRTIRTVAALALLTTVLVLKSTPPASAGVQFAAVPTFPATVTVGDAFAAGLRIQNISTPPDTGTTVVVNDITLVPSCGTTAPSGPGDCPAANVDPDVFSLSATGTGEAGSACGGVTFTITEIDTVQGKYRLAPPAATTITLQPPGLPLDTCVINFTATVLKRPTQDSAPASPGLQTAQIGYAAGGTVNTSGAGIGVSNVTVNAAQPTLTTDATPDTATIGQPVSDIATVTGRVNPTAGNTVTFRLFSDAVCTTQVFTSTNAVSAGGTATSSSFTPTAAGIYHWVAEYSGDPNNNPVSGLCSDPEEDVVVQAAQPTLTTDATPDTATVGQPLSDIATVTGRVNPTGGNTVTFRLFSDAVCTAQVFTSTNALSAGGTATSDAFTPTQPGTYRWVATYSGDPNNNPASGLCSDPEEDVVVTPASSIQVDKTASPLSRPEPGGDFTYNIVLTNTGPAVLTVTALTDNVYGNLATRPNSTCTDAVGVVLQPTPGPGNIYSCSFTAPFAGEAGDALTDIVTVTATDPQANQVSDTDDAIVTLTNVVPSVSVDKTASPLSRPAPGGEFTFTVVITNTSPAEPVTITSITDDIYGNLATRPGSTCGALIATTLAPGASSAPCSFTGTFNGNGGASQTDVVTVVVSDNENTTATDTDDATVRLTAVPTLTTQASPATTVGQPITDTATLANGFNPTGTITFDLYGPNNATCTGTPPFTSTVTVNNGNGTYTSGAFTPTQPGSYQWIARYSGDANNEAATTACNDPTENTVVSAPPLSIQVDKTASPLSRPEPGGDFTFSVVVTNNSAEDVAITSLTDNIYGNLATRAGSSCNTAIGTVLQPTPGPGNTYTCSFTAPFAGEAGDAQTDIVTAVVSDNPNSGRTATDTDDAIVTLTNVVPSVSVDKTASPLSRPAPGGEFTFTVVITNTSPAEPVTITSITDDIYGNLATRPGSTCGALIATTLAPGASSAPCSFTGTFNGNGGASQTDVVTVVVSDNENTTATDTDDATVRLTAVPTLTTQASPATTVGQPITDTATLASGFNPTGTITFDLYGPNNATCTGTPPFTSTVTVNNGNGTYTSGAFTPTQPGSYQWQRPLQRRCQQRGGRPDSLQRPDRVNRHRQGHADVDHPGIECRHAGSAHQRYGDSGQRDQPNRNHHLRRLRPKRRHVLRGGGQYLERHGERQRQLQLPAVHPDGPGRLPLAGDL